MRKSEILYLNMIVYLNDEQRRKTHAHMYKCKYSPESINTKKIILFYEV